MQTSILIPFRDDDHSRMRTFTWIERRWQHLMPEAEICIGTDTGTPFSKTAAVNDAYTRSTGDTLIVCDADSWISNPATAVAHAFRTGHLVVPWNDVLRATAEDSADILNQWPENFHIPSGARRRALPPPKPLTAGMCFVIRRDAFEFVCGMDPRFRGYGHEDVAFRRACDVLLRTTLYMGGTVFSLYHPRPKTNGKRTWENDVGNMNAVLADRYAKAARHRKRLRDLCNEHPLPGQTPPIERLFPHSVPTRTI